MVSLGLAITHIGRTSMTSSRKKVHEHGWLEAKQSGGAVYEQGVRQSKESTAVRRIAAPLMERHWKNSVTNLHRIYRVAEYLYRRTKRHN
tara:strand:- start:409 stop:678 length:270 start_codon:yes stop_codon:yes gene_type:complete